MIQEKVGLDQIRTSFEKNGYVLLPEFFSGRELRDMQTVFDRIEAEAAKREAVKPEGYLKFETRPINFPLNDEPAALELAGNPRLREVTESLIGTGFSALPPASWCTKTGCGQAWHQDTASEEPHQFVLNRLIYVRQIDAELGCLYVVPGSHKAGDIPRGENHAPLEGEVAIEAPVGTLALMHSRCYHRVGINQSEKPRIQMNSRALPAKVKGMPTDRTIFRTGRWDFSTKSEW